VGPALVATLYVRAGLAPDGPEVRAALASIQEREVRLRCECAHVPPTPACSYSGALIPPWRCSVLNLPSFLAAHRVGWPGVPMAQATAGRRRIGAVIAAATATPTGSALARRGASRIGTVRTGALVA